MVSILYKKKKKIELLDHTEVLVIDELENLNIKDQKEEKKKKRSKREEEASLRTLGPWAYAERPRDRIGPIRTCTAQEKEIPTTCRLFSSMKVGTDEEKQKEDKEN
ncbi:hypothetical protein V1478_016944 [Vespula squamosa]|uniref:Uncharacterized protein n=1 Tax=Vespula squamosa TaxID=30214 RepID=A0ABD1ZY08_VESSQ